jgi:hypothetical protein
MPLSGKDREMESSFERQYGDRGKSVYYATLNKRINEGRPINTPESKHVASKRKKRKSKRTTRRSRRRGRK